MQRQNAPRWARPAECETVTCGICGQTIYAGEEYEAVKTRRAKEPNYYHTDCVRKERGGTGQ